MPAVSSHPDSLCSNWTTARITDLVKRRFKKRPCWYQIEVVKAFYAGQDIIGCAPTGAGKTLSFWIPLLMAQEDGESISVFLLNPLSHNLPSNLLVRQPS
jgi:superfamily II DNA/RNA helicase